MKTVQNQDPELMEGYHAPILDSNDVVRGSIDRQPGSATTVVSIKRNGIVYQYDYRNGGNIVDRLLRTKIPANYFKMKGGQIK